MRALRNPLVRVVAFLAAVAPFIPGVLGERETQLRLGNRLLEFTGADGHTFVDTDLDAGEIEFPVSFSIWGHWFDDGTERVKIFGWYDDITGPNRGELEIWDHNLILRWYAGDTVLAPPPPGNEWVHYGVVITAEDARLYMNGDPVGSIPSQSIDTGRSLWIGARPYPGMHEDNFSGWLKDWIVFDGDIGDEGMRRIAGGGELPAVEILQHLPLTDGEGTVVHDRSGRGVHGRIEGAVWSTDVPPLVGRGQPVAIDLHLTDARGTPRPRDAYEDLITASAGSVRPSPVSIGRGEHTVRFEWSHDEPGTHSILAGHPDLAGDELKVRVGILAALQDDQASVREMAIRTIYLTGVAPFVDKLSPADYEKALDALFAIIEGADEPHRTSAVATAIRFLGTLEERGGEPEVKTLRAALGKGPDRTLRTRAARALGSLRDTGSIKALLAAMEEGKPDLRVSAAYALKAMEQPVEFAFTNPYEAVDWDSVGYYHGNFHTHTHFSDGQYDPHYAIDRYRAMGYDILALTDHDTYYQNVWDGVLYPWTKLNEIYHQIKDKDSYIHNRPYREIVDEEWQNRDPEELGMVSIPGTEITIPHHIGSLFSHYAGGVEDEETALREIGEQGGLAIFYHPGRYDREADWYVDFYRRHPHLIGIEPYNQMARYRGDRRMWDSILYQLMPDRPVWGFANDDTHSLRHFGWNRNVFVLPELSKEHVFEAMQDGNFYFFVPFEQETPPAMKLREVATEGETVRLKVDGEYDRVEWMTHNPDTGANHAVGDGLEISIADIFPPSTFVRAVIIGESGRAYTQPFGVRATVHGTIEPPGAETRAPAD